MKHFTTENFPKEVLESPVPVLVDFYADWCGPCQTVGPILEEVAQEAQGFVVGKVNVDENPALANQYGVEMIPHFCVFQKGEVTLSQLGLMSKSEILDMMNHMT